MLLVPVVAAFATVMFSVNVGFVESALFPKEVDKSVVPKVIAGVINLV
jgi:hypothetical protein